MTCTKVVDDWFEDEFMKSSNEINYIFSSHQQTKNIN